MTDRNQFSDELINAFVDGELDAEARAELLADEHQDERLCEARRLKELVRHAYTNPPEPQPGEAHARTGRITSGIAAGLMLMLVGALGGFLISDIRWSEESVVSANASGATTIPAAENVLLHVTSGEEAMMNAALDYAESILDEGRKEGVARQVEVVANEAGLDLLRSDVSPFAARIRKLSRQNPELVFYACSRAVERLEEQGVNVRLLPEVRTGQSALERAVRRMQEGWQYHKI